MKRYTFGLFLLLVALSTSCEKEGIALRVDSAIYMRISDSLGRDRLNPEHPNSLDSSDFLFYFVNLEGETELQGNFYPWGFEPNWWIFGDPETGQYTLSFWLNQPAEEDVRNLRNLDSPEAQEIFGRNYRTLISFSDGDTDTIDTEYKPRVVEGWVFTEPYRVWYNGVEYPKPFLLQIEK